MKTTPSLPKILIFLTVALSSIATSAQAAEVSTESATAIRAEINTLVDDYGYYRDTLDASGYANVFAEDGKFLFHGDVFQGREVLKKRVEDANPATVSMHMISTGHIVIIDNDNATGIHYASIYSNTPEKAVEVGTAITVNGPVVVGKYSDTYARTEEGWKITERSFTPVFNTPK